MILAAADINIVLMYVSWLKQVDFQLRSSIVVFKTYQLCLGDLRLLTNKNY